MNTHEQGIRHFLDMISAGAIIASIVGILPSIAALMGIIWYAVQIFTAWEKRRDRKRALLAAALYRRRATDELVTPKTHQP